MSIDTNRQADALFGSFLPLPANRPINGVFAEVGATAHPDDGAVPPNPPVIRPLRFRMGSINLFSATADAVLNRRTPPDRGKIPFRVGLR